MFGKITIPATLVLATVPPVAAQQYADAGDFQLQSWTYDALYEAGSWTVEELFDRPVAGTTGDEIGDVEDLVFNLRGEVVALVAEVGGFWDIGDTHVSVPWENVSMPTDGPVEIPVTEDTLDQYSVFDYSGLPGTKMGDDIVSDIANQDLFGVWRASDLIGDYVRIQDDDRAWFNYGYVSDLVVRDAQIISTVVATDQSLGGEDYAYPLFDRPTPPGTSRGLPWSSQVYDIPVLQGDASALPSFEADRVGTE